MLKKATYPLIYNQTNKMKIKIERESSEGENFVEEIEEIITDLIEILSIRLEEFVLNFKHQK